MSIISKSVKYAYQDGNSITCEDGIWQILFDCGATHGNCSMESCGSREAVRRGGIYRNAMAHSRQRISGSYNGGKADCWKESSMNWARADLEDIGIDSTYIKAHKASAGARRGGD